MAKSPSKQGSPQQDTGDANPEPMKAVLDVAKGSTENGDGIVTLSTGIRARLHPVAASLMSEVTSQFKAPKVPNFYNETKDREEPNPQDPAYLEAVEEVNRQKGQAGLDAMIMFGVELVDGLPENEEWLRKLRFFEKRGQLDLSDFDVEDPMDMEFLYKRFIAVGNADFAKITALSGVSEEAIQAEMDNFPSS